MFTSRDLDLHLPSDHGRERTAKGGGGGDDQTNHQFVPLKFKEESKVIRYRAGQAPAWSGESSSNLNTSSSSSLSKLMSSSSSYSSSSSSSSSYDNNGYSSIVKNESKSGGSSSSLQDGRLSRLTQSKPSNNSSSSNSGSNDCNSSSNAAAAVVEDAMPPRRRRIYEAQVVVDADDAKGADKNLDSSSNSISGGSGNDTNNYRSNNEGTVDFDRGDRRNQPLFGDSSSSSSSSKDDNNMATASSMSRRERALARRQQESESDSSSNVSSSEEDDSDEEDNDDYEYHAAALKPIFVPKHMRQSTANKEIIEKEEEERLKRASNEKNSRILSTREIVAESIRRNEKEDSFLLFEYNDDGIPDDADRSDDDDEEEFENWKLREITRLKRDALRREAVEAEKADVLRRRNMTDDERIEEDKKLGLGKFKAQDNKKWKFLQKYYHRGAFYMDEDTLAKGGENDVRKRNYDAAPTGEDQFNFEALPKILQVKDFGKRGKTKYTHLKDQDTSDFQNRIRKDQFLSTKYVSKMGGIGDIDNDGRLRKKGKIED